MRIVERFWRRFSGSTRLTRRTHYDGCFFAGSHVKSLQYLLYCRAFSVKTGEETSRRTAHGDQTGLPTRNRRETGGFGGFRRQGNTTPFNVRRLPSHFCASFCKEVAEKLDVLGDFEAETGTKMAGRMRAVNGAVLPLPAPKEPARRARRIERYCLQLFSCREAAI